MNLRLTIAYDGAAYHGWAEQPTVPTVQGTLRAALGQLLNVDATTIQMQGASRTDAGVHALGQVVNVHHDTDRTTWDFVRGLNALTPDDITIWTAEEVPAAFNARHDSIGKRYRYRFWLKRFCNPLERHVVWNVRVPLQLSAMQRAAAALVGTHDFSSFRAADCQARSTVRELTRVELVEADDEIILWVEGTAFLKYMVRNIAGTLVDIGRGHMSADSMPGILAAHDRREAGQTAPPHGLALMQVFYD